MQIRPLDRADVPRIWDEIDRSETHDEIYVVRDGALELAPFHFEIRGWQLEMVEHDAPRLERADVLLGAFDGGRLVGVLALEGERLYYLYVDAAHRGRGVGSALFEAAVSRVPRLLVSSIPTRNTVEFYLARGCRLDPSPPAEQVAAEPDDVQLIWP